MAQHVGDVEAYREWAAQQEHLPVFARPGWLDVVAPDGWRAEMLSDGRGRLRRAWAYVPRQRLGLRYSTLPPATPYLGPYWASARTDAPDAPPAGVGYAAFTVHDPSAAWRFGSACRAMATQVVDLRHRPRYDSDLRRRLRRGAEQMRVSPVSDPGAFADLRRLLGARPEAAPPAWTERYATAHARGLARAYAVYVRGGRLQAMAVVPYDERRAYLTVQIRAAGAHPATTTVLLDRILADLCDAGIEQLDMESGYLSGIRSFHARFGARPEWYGQVRLARNPAWRVIDGLRALANRNRL